MHETIARRIERLRARIVEERLDALIATAESNVRYLTDFTGDSSALLVTTERAVIISDGRYATQLEDECLGFEHRIRTIGRLLPTAIGEVVGELRATRLGVEAATLTIADAELLRENLAAGTTIVPTMGIVEGLRIVKDERELAAIRDAIAIAERAFSRWRAGLRLDETEKTATDLLEADLRRCGASGAAFPPIVAAGANAALPHHRGTDRNRLDHAGFVLVDWGASTAPQPYKSDLTRVVVTGKVTPTFERVYRAVLDAQDRAISAIRPGVMGRDVDAAARRALDEAGYGDRFTHGLGHGFGLDIHEAPLLHRSCETVLQPGMVVTVEPGVYLPGELGVRIEDDVLVTPDGREVLTRVPKALDSLRP